MTLDPVSALIDIGGKVFDRLFPDPAQAANAKLELLKLQQNGDLAVITKQLEINAKEAQHTSLFVSGWRPSVGWVCSIAFAWNWIGLPVATFVAAYIGKTLDLAPADLSEMMPVLMGLLGLGGLRTYEKIHNVARK